MPAAAPQKKHFLSPFKNSSFAVFWFANLMSNIAGWMQQVAEPWLILQVTHSPFLLGLDSFANDIPFFLLTMASGKIADTYDRRKILLSTQGLQLLCPLIIIAMLLTNHVFVAVIIFLSLVVGITDSLSGPAFQTLMPSVVEKDQIAQAVSLGSTQYNISRIVGPLMAGFFMATFGAVSCFGVNALSYIPFLAAIWWIKLPKRQIVKSPEGKLNLFSLEGYREIISANGLWAPLALVATNACFCGPLITFTSLIAQDVLKMGPKGFSLLLTAFGVGGLSGASLMTWLAARAKNQILLLRRLPFVSLFVSSVTIILIATQSRVNTVLALMFVAGLAFISCNISVSSLLQLQAEDKNRGKVSSLYIIAMRGGAPLGSLVCGSLATAFGIQKTLMWSAGAALFVWLLLLYSDRRSLASATHDRPAHMKLPT